MELELNKSLLTDFPTAPIELVEGQEVFGWVQAVEKDRTEILLCEGQIARLSLNDVSPLPLSPKPKNMKDIFDRYDYIAATVKDLDGSNVSYDMSTGMKRIGDVSWEIIEDGFLETIEIEERKGTCERCGQNIVRKKAERRLKPELLDSFARKVAVISSENSLKKNQLRNFYDEMKAAQGRIERTVDRVVRESELQLQKPRIKLLLAQAANAQARGNIPKVFHEFLKRGVEIVTQKEAKYEDFEAFVLTFEAVTGFFKEKKEK